jgi:hypothetical protein
MGADYSWQFTVEAAQYPVVLSTSPAADDTNIVRDTLVTATFSENVNGVDGSSFKLWEGDPDAGGTEVTTVSVGYDNVSFVATLLLPGNKLHGVADSDGLPRLQILWA